LGKGSSNGSRFAFFTKYVPEVDPFGTAKILKVTDVASTSVTIAFS